MMPGMSDVNARIKRLRQDRGLTQQQLASKADLAMTTVHRIESDAVEPTVSTLEAIARALDVSLSDLLADDEPQPTP
jgi:transcriptional regulator with XRE-family HTH domain